QESEHVQPTAIDSKSKSHPNERIAFIQASWHKDIVDQSRKGFVAEMANLGYAESDIDFFEVGGAFEIPLHAKLLAKTGRYAGIVGAALVVDGGIYRHEFVAQAVVSALMQVQLETEVPVFSVSLTPHHFHAGEEHHKFFFDHFVHKGAEAARTCADTLNKIRAIRRLDAQQKAS
ncbi:MAG: ribH, partial [Pseudomonas sp.]|nr:ribH [Pseudomonas sp.]